MSNHFSIKIHIHLNLQANAFTLSSAVHNVMYQPLSTFELMSIERDQKSTCQLYYNSRITMLVRLVCSKEVDLPTSDRNYHALLVTFIVPRPQ